MRDGPAPLFLGAPLGSRPRPRRRVRAGTGGQLPLPPLSRPLPSLSFFTPDSRLPTSPVILLFSSLLLRPSPPLAPKLSPSSQKQSALPLPPPLFPTPPDVSPCGAAPLRLPRPRPGSSCQGLSEESRPGSAFPTPGKLAWAFIILSATGSSARLSLPLPSPRMAGPSG